jgi:hypothetical protein
MLMLMLMLASVPSDADAARAADLTQGAVFNKIFG